VAGSLLRLDRLDEAGELLKSTQEPKVDCFHLQVYRYALAFLQDNQPEMAKTVSASGERWEIQFFYLQARTAAYYGQLRESRELMRRCLLSARKSGQEELGGFFQGLAAESEALLGDPELAKKEAREALARSRVRDVESVGAVALALAQDDKSAQALADDLVKRFRESTLVQRHYVPSVNAQLALSRRDAPKALEYLQAAAPYELGDPDGTNALLPIFLRSQAYLMARQGRQAAGEFQKILDHRAIVLSSPIGALARLQIARAFTMQGDTAKARAAYQDFLNLWKNADSDIPVLKQAKAEYAKLQ
jgi:tetratricopeptide (TPR) repeat protein